MADVDDVDELIATRKLHGLEDNLYKDIKTEDNIKRCEKLTEPQNANWIGISNQMAIAGVLARIKELEEENKISKNGVDLFCDDYVPKQKVKDLIKSEIIDISGFECIAVEDLEELLSDAN